MKKVLALLLAMVLVLSLAACGGTQKADELTASLIGTWEYSWYASAVDQMGCVRFEFKENGDCARIDDNAVKKTTEGKYTIDKDNKEIKVQYDDDSTTLKYEVEDGKVTSVIYSGDNVMKKVG